MPRTAETARKTRETDITLRLNLDGSGKAVLDTGIGFFEHMLDLFTCHSLCDITLTARGDTRVDLHHTVEDVGLVLGETLQKALGDKRGIKRYGFASVPMDEALTQTTVDLGGRPHLAFSCAIPAAKTGEFDTELCRDFFQAVATAGKMNIHVTSQGGINSHHIIESVFKSFARALREAVATDGREGGVPSTKGVL